MIRALRPILLLLMVSTSVIAKGADSDCKPQLLAQVRLELAPDGGVYVPVTLGKREALFRLSVGSGLPFVLESSVSSLGLTPRLRNRGADISGSGRTVTQYVELEEMKIGGFDLLARAAPILPQPGVDAPPELGGRIIAGIMGSTLFQNVDAEIYLAERQLKLFKPFRCRSQSPVYWGGEAAELPLHFDAAGTLVFTLELEGRKVEASFLTGARESTIDVNVTRQFFGFDDASSGAGNAAPDERDLLGVFHAMSLTGPGLRIADAKVRMRPGNRCKLTASTHVYGAIGYSDCVNSVPFILGTDVLSQLRIYISRMREKVYVTVVDKAASPADSGSVTVDAARSGR